MQTDPSEYFSEEARSEPFSYTCNRCLHCCQFKNIQVNPYEVARLAKNLGISTTELREKHTEDGDGVILAHTEDMKCVFLNEQGCTVHPDRPLVCRLYPLGRVVQKGEKEQFIHSEPHPETKGIYGKSGTIQQFLDAQDTKLFIEAADEYFDWICSAMNSDLSAAESEDSDEAYDLLDFDKAISVYCVQKGLQEPIDIEDRKRLHLKILDESLESVSAS